MPAAEDRQAKALETINHSLKELVRIMAAMNENFVVVGTALKEATEREEAARVDKNQIELPISYDMAECECYILRCSKHGGS